MNKKAKGDADSMHLPMRLRYTGWLLIQGCSYKEIGRHRRLKLNTVRRYARELYDLTDTHSRWKLMLWDREHPGVLLPPPAPEPPTKVVPPQADRTEEGYGQ